jgi:hypothetical protein
MAWFPLHSGFASMFGSFLAWALSFITSGKLYVYQVCSGAAIVRQEVAKAYPCIDRQILFLIVGLLTVITAPFIL